MGTLRFSIQLHDERTGAAILQSGGTVTVCQSGDAAKQAVLTKAGAAASNPVAISNGRIEFYTADSVNQVDLYGIGPNGEAIILTGVKPSGDAAYYVSRSLNQVYKLPLAMADGAVAENDTGHDLVANSIVHPQGLGVLVTTPDDTETVDVGLLSSESGGDADGFMAGLAVSTAGMKVPVIANGANTQGALLESQDSANAGDLVPRSHVVGAAKSVTWTPSAGSDTLEGFILLPVTLPA
jgi:hypothetical protein